MRLIGLLVGAAIAVMVPGRAGASQFVVTDVTYTHSSTTTTDSHYRVLPSAETPPDWTSPIDYATAGGTAHVRLQVFTKPTDVPTRFQICFEATPSYACTDQAPPYTTTGTYDWSTEFPSFYQFSSVDWSKGIVKAALILKDTHNVKPAPENVGEAVSAMYMPTDLRVTVTIVSPGGTYVPPGDPAGPDAGVTADAAVAGDAPPAAETAPSGGGCAAAPDAGGSPAVVLLIGLAAVTASRRRRTPSG